MDRLLTLRPSLPLIQRRPRPRVSQMLPIPTMIRLRFDARALLDAGANAREVCNAYDVDDLVKVNVTAREMYEAEKPVYQLRKRFSAVELRHGGYTCTQLLAGARCANERALFGCANA